MKFDLGYSGSDQFARDHRFMATPSVSGAWVASNEAFLRDSRWLTLLKIRASYGKTANDLLDSQRFSYMDDVRQVRGGTVTAYRYVLQEGLIGNPLFEAEVSKKQNYGIDIGRSTRIPSASRSWRRNMRRLSTRKTIFYIWTAGRSTSSR